jgi:hypothetical protein
MIYGNDSKLSSNDDDGNPPTLQQLKKAHQVCSKSKVMLIVFSITRVFCTVSMLYKVRQLTNTQQEANEP